MQCDIRPSDHAITDGITNALNLIIMRIVQGIQCLNHILRKRSVNIISSSFDHLDVKTLLEMN